MSESIQQIDNHIEVITPENVRFHYEVAGPFRRLPAFLLDACVVYGFLTVLSIVMVMADIMVLGGMGTGMLLICILLLPNFYGGVLETLWNGQTIGKRAMGLRVLSIDGQPINALQAVMRNLLRIVDAMPLCYLIGLITAASNNRFQRLGDLACRTMVVVESRKQRVGAIQMGEPRAAQLAAYIPADFEVTNSLGKAIAEYVERRKNFSTARRHAIAKHLGVVLLRRFNMPRDTSYDLLLCALYFRTFIAEEDQLVPGGPIPMLEPALPIEAPTFVSSIGSARGLR